MSRGLSAQQRAILAVIEEGPITIRGLANRFDPWMSYSRYESIRRALSSLVKRGLIAEREGFWPKEFCTLAAAEEWERKKLLALVWQTVLGRAAIVRKFGRLPTLTEWLKVGSLEMLDDPNTSQVERQIEAP